MLAGKYMIFGHVIDGMDVLDRMEKLPTGTSAIESALRSHKV